MDSMDAPSQPPPPEPPTGIDGDGDTEMKEVAQEFSSPVPAPADQQSHPQQPPLGRNASLGDTQPTLAERQVSVGVPSAAAAAPVMMPVPTNGGPSPPKPPPPSASPPAPSPPPPPPPVAPPPLAPPSPPKEAERPAAVEEEAPPAPKEASPIRAPPAPSPPAVQVHAPVAEATPPIMAQPQGLAFAGVVPQMPAASPPQAFVEKVSPPAVSAPVVAAAAPAPLVAQRPPGPPGLGLASMPSAGAAAAAAAAAASSASDDSSEKSSEPTPPPLLPQAAVPAPPAALPPPSVPPPAAAAAPSPPPAPKPKPPPPPAVTNTHAAPRPQPVPGMRELRVEDALLYLDDVKREFGDRPRVYNEFLAIMKNFKSQEVDTPGVIARVSKLFRGYNNLILGFNKFLPDGYKISLADLQEMDAQYAREQEDLRRQARQSSEEHMLHGNNNNEGGHLMHAPTQFPGGPRESSSAPPSKKPGGKRTYSGKDSLLREERPRGPPGLGPSSAAPTAAARSAFPAAGGAQKKSPPPAPRPAAQRSAAAPAPAPQQAVEFDHAISYVTTIKRRFADDPSTYHSFLEILHTYQKEQRGIKEVLEQVAHLFQDHPDLLKEFTFFLPDAVQEQAKERLHRAAADSEARMAAQARALEAQKHGGGDDMDVDQNGSSNSQHRLIDMTGHSRPDTDASRGRKRSHKEAAAAAAMESSSAAPIVLPQQPESYVYNSAVERQFFDTAREALAAYTRDGGQAWAEFLKCLDMYAQEILSRSEMFNFVEPLLGKRNNKLFEEFKRIISYAGAQAANNAPNVEDSWYSVPLSEIDFSRCRRCSPSYRALPRDYPSPPCGDRSDEEAKILNDVWVSLPVGSEESYTFRHMRRNTYEETLFRCEDERFEIDMVIDSNAATLARLEPIAEEIAQLAENELIVPESSNTPKPASADQGMGGKRYHYTFDKTIMGVIHRNSISRIYGDAGQEMLDLIVKNPTVAVPLVVERLRQKDMEWRKVRSRLNKRWKELAEHNYYRSLDHRSLTWRTTDKRAISTRTLVSEIKDRAVNDGLESAASFQVRLDKAKEEHGGFYEVTKGAALKKQLDLTNLPKPDRRLFTPHMSLMYEDTSWAHQDAYRILSFALERGSISPSDKERCHRLWFDFLGPWFNLGIDWMSKPAVNFQETTKPVSAGVIPRIVSNGDESMADDDDEDSVDEDGEIAARVVTEDVRQMKPDEKHNSPAYMDHHPLPAGATVATLYGDGRIIKCRRSDNTYMVQLPFGTAYLRPSAVVCSIIPAEKSAFTSQLRAADHTKLARPGDMLAVGTQSLYLFFRLHQILVRRLGIAKKLAYAVRDDPTLINMVEQMPGDDAAALGRRRYDAYLSLVFALLDGGHTLSGTAAEGGKYEDRVRALLGHGGFELATMDKLISHILKNLQSMANDDTMWNLVQLYRRHLALGSFKPEAFRMEAGYLSDGEQMYAFQMCPLPKDKGDKSVLHMEYLGSISESGGGETPIEADLVEASQVAKRQKR